MIHSSLLQREKIMQDDDYDIAKNVARTEVASGRWTDSVGNGRGLRRSRDKNLIRPREGLGAGVVLSAYDLS